MALYDTNTEKTFLLEKELRKARISLMAIPRLANVELTVRKEREILWLDTRLVTQCINIAVPET